MKNPPEGMTSAEVRSMSDDELLDMDYFFHEFDNINDDIVYEAFEVEGNEVNAFNDSYLELFELIGKEAMLKLFKHFRGDKIDCPMRLYRPEFIADLARTIADRRERAKIARAGGYSAKVIEAILNKRRKEVESE